MCQNTQVLRYGLSMELPPPALGAAIPTELRTWMQGPCLSCRAYRNSYDKAITLTGIILDGFLTLSINMAKKSSNETV